MRLAGLQRCQPTRLVAQDVWPYEGRAGGHKGALPRAPGLVSQISSIDEIWPRGAGSADYEPLTAPQWCQPTPAVGLGCLGTVGLLRRPPRSLAACARPREPNVVHRRNLASPARAVAHAVTRAVSSLVATRHHLDRPVGPATSAPWPCTGRGAAPDRTLTRRPRPPLVSGLCCPRPLRYL